METQTKRLEEKIRILLEKHEVISRQDLIESLWEWDPHLKVTTIDWLLYKLRERGGIVNAGRGKYSLQEVSKFMPHLSSKLKWIFAKVQKKYQPNEILLWETKWLNEFMTHQPFGSMIIIEIEQELLESVYFYLKDNVKNEVYLLSGFVNQSASLRGLMDNYILETRNPIIVKRYISRSPKQKAERVTIPTLEKILVDVFCDPVLFTTYHGWELENIFVNAFKRYVLTRKRMMSYAKRRNISHQLSEFIQMMVDNHVEGKGKS